MTLDRESPSREKHFFRLERRLPALLRSVGKDREPLSRHANQ